MTRFAAALFLCALAAFAQDDREDYRLEVTASGWHTSVEGAFQSNALPVDLRSDLNLQPRWTFVGNLAWKPARQHRIVVEGAPFSFEGRNGLQRTIQYFGRTFRVQDIVSSRADLTYVYGGYQYDVVSRHAGHFGFNIGGAFLDAEGTIASETLGSSATDRRRIGVPLIGAEFRAYPLQRIELLRGINVGGSAKGAPLGPFGYFVQGRIDGGYTIGPFNFVAGWAILDADIHENRDISPTGVAPHITGPVIGVQFRMR